MENAIQGVVTDVSSPSTNYHFLVVDDTRYGTYMTPPDCNVGDTVSFNAYQKGSFWNVSGKVSVVSRSSIPTTAMSVSKTALNPALNPVLANLGLRVGASMNQAVNSFSHGAIRKEDIPDFALELLRTSLKIENIVKKSVPSPQQLQQQLQQPQQQPQPQQPQPKAFQAFQPLQPQLPPTSMAKINMADDFDDDIPF